MIYPDDSRCGERGVLSVVRGKYRDESRIHANNKRAGPLGHDERGDSPSQQSIIFVQGSTRSRGRIRGSNPHRDSRLHYDRSTKRERHSSSNRGLDEIADLDSKFYERWKDKAWIYPSTIYLFNFIQLRNDQLVNNSKKKHLIKLRMIDYPLVWRAWNVQSSKLTN